MTEEEFERQREEMLDKAQAALHEIIPDDLSTTVVITFTDKKVSMSSVGMNGNKDDALQAVSATMQFSISRFKGCRCAPCHRAAEIMEDALSNLKKRFTLATCH